MRPQSNFLISVIYPTFSELRNTGYLLNSSFILKLWRPVPNIYAIWRIYRLGIKNGERNKRCFSNSHYTDVTVASWRLESPTTRQWSIVRKNISMLWRHNALWCICGLLVISLLASLGYIPTPARTVLMGPSSRLLQTPIFHLPCRPIGCLRRVRRNPRRVQFNLGIKEMWLSSSGHHFSKLRGNI